MGTSVFSCDLWVHLCACRTPVHTEAETPGILVAENPLESSLTRSQIESHKPKPPKYFVSKAHVMAGDERELSLFLGQKVEVCVCVCVCGWVGVVWMCVLCIHKLLIFAYTHVFTYICTRTYISTYECIYSCVCCLIRSWMTAAMTGGW